MAKKKVLKPVNNEKGELRLFNEERYSNKYDGYKLNEIDLVISTKLRSKKDVDELLLTLEILKQTLPTKKYCITCGRELNVT